MKRVVLELSEGPDPISGSIAGDGVDLGWFHGYMELVAVLEAARSGAPPDRMATGTNQPTDRSGDE